MKRTRLLSIKQEIKASISKDVKTFENFENREDFDIPGENLMAVSIDLREFEAI